MEVQAGGCPGLSKPKKGITESPPQRRQAMPPPDLLTSKSRGSRVTLCIGRMRNEIIGRPPHSGFLSICFKVSLNKGFVVLEQDKKPPLTLFFSYQDFPAAFHARETQHSDGTAAELRAHGRGGKRTDPLAGDGKAPGDVETTERRVKAQMYQQWTQTRPVPAARSGDEQPAQMSLTHPVRVLTSARPV